MQVRISQKFVQGINRLGVQNCDAQLKVRVPPAAPHFERPLEDKITKEGQKIILETEISGFPDPNVSFMIKGKPVSYFLFIQFPIRSVRNGICYQFR